MKAHTRTDLIAGGVVGGFGLFFSLYAYSNYRLGTLTQMGPGFYPFLIGCVLVGLGLLILAEAFAKRNAEGPAEEAAQINYRGFVTVVASIVSFGLVLVTLGFIPASIVSTIIASRIGSTVTVFKTLAMTAVVVTMTVLIFIVGLGIRVPLFKSPF